MKAQATDIGIYAANKKFDFKMEYEFEIMDDMGSRLKIFAKHIKTLAENYTTLTVGETEQRFEGSLYDLSMEPIKITHQLNDKSINFELSYGQKFDDLTLKLNEVDFDFMLTGPLPEQPEEILRSKIYNNFNDGHMSKTQFNFYSGEDQELVKIEVSYSRKLKLLKIAADKRERIVRGKKLTDPSLFPIIF